MPYYLKQPIHIAEYDPQWPYLYEEEKECLQTALGSVLVAIEHFGSTSVPGLEAKPIIDMLVGVRDLGDIDAVVPALQRLGYEDARINPVFQRRLFCKGPYNEGSHALHFVVYGSDPWLVPLRFRDYLRTHARTRTNYGALKKQLARNHGRDLDGYSVDKGPFIAAILAIASR